MSKHSTSNEASNSGEMKKEILLLDGEDNTVNVETEVKGIDIVKKNGKNLCENFIVSEVINECPSRAIKPIGKDGFLVVKIPVVISELDIEINCEASIKLDQPAFEIKRIKKNVFLTQCKLLPSVRKLFLSGFIRKNIEYASIKPKETKGGSNIRHFTAEIPFICTTVVDYFVPPIISPVKANREIEIYNSNICDCEPSEINCENIEYFNEKIYCELEQAQIAEMEYFEEDSRVDATEEKIFQSITEKMVLNLRLKLLQNQEVNIYPLMLPEKKARKKKSIDTVVKGNDQ